MVYEPISVSQAASEAVEVIRKNGGAGYSKPGKVLVSGMGVYEWRESENCHRYEFRGTYKLTLTEGDKIIVTVNGKKYNLTCTIGGTSRFACGNPTLAGWNTIGDTGEDICFARTSTSYMFCKRGEAITQDSVMITASEPDKIIPIDPKYIPWDSMPGGGSGGGLPVVEIANIANITAEESAALDKVATTDTPIIVKFVYMDINHAWLFNKSFVGNVFLYTCHTSLDGGVATVSVVKRDKWIFDIVV